MIQSTPKRVGAVMLALIGIGLLASTDIARHLTERVAEGAQARAHAELAQRQAPDCAPGPAVGMALALAQQSRSMVDAAVMAHAEREAERAQRLIDALSLLRRDSGAEVGPAVRVTGRD